MPGDAAGGVEILDQQHELTRGLVEPRHVGARHAHGDLVGQVPVEERFAPAHADYTNRLLGSQITGGSTGVREAWTRLRERRKPKKD